VYRSDLRPAVLFGAFLALLWSLIAGIASFRNVPFFNSNNEKNLGILYIVLGCIGMAIVVIEAFGIFAVASRRLAAVRTYAYLSILATLLIAADYIIQTVIHYSFKNDIINLCTNVNEGDRVFFTGFFGPIDGGVVTPLEARAWCSREYDRDSFSNIVALLVVTAVAALFAAFVFAHLRQLRDPTSAANFSRVRVPVPVNMNNFNYGNQPYSNQPYDQYNPTYTEPFNPPKKDGSLAPPYEFTPQFTPPAYEGSNTKLGDQKDEWGRSDH